MKPFEEFTANLYDELVNKFGDDFIGFAYITEVGGHIDGIINRIPFKICCFDTTVYFKSCYEAREIMLDIKTILDKLLKPYNPGLWSSTISFEYNESELSYTLRRSLGEKDLSKKYAKRLR